MRILASDRRRAAFVVAFAMSAAIAGGGCSSTQARPGWMQTLTFWDEKQEHPGFKGPTPAERISDLRATAEKLPAMSVVDQQSQAAELTRAYREESDPLIRAEIIRTIAWCGSTTAADTLQAALSDSERDVRLAACDAWAAHGGPRAVAQLGEALKKDADVDVRLAAARCLGRMKDPEAVAAISPALEDPNPAMQYRAVQSLREMTGKDFGDDANAWRDYVRGGKPEEISVAERMKLKAF